ncbi:hypothetical protein V2H45_01245 [Tumidithrix elongata RA019]|uniref:Uncharacterized protein n=1 Tax=Tumidithrix elongata BACA0141 TaxID=2716417 RepID=A0AAW9PWQ4_9CYAN|nr:hypothetical protein [Tumidithrix elongata RA019]
MRNGMRSQLHLLLFVLFGAVVQTTVACTNQQTANTDATQQKVLNADTSSQEPTASASKQPTAGADKSMPQPTLIAGTYNLGSRYITIANQGNRTCYESFSTPSGRYALSVGETAGSLTSEKDYFAIDGWKKYGKALTLRQSGRNLLITDQNGSPEEYTFFQPIANDKYSEVLAKCLNSTDSFFELQPGYSISSTTTQTDTRSAVTGNLLTPEQIAQLKQLPIPIVAPTSLPSGFRLVKASGEKAKYANGDDDSGYIIAYEGENNTCISVTSSQSGSRGLEKMRDEQTEFGTLEVYIEKARDSSVRNIVTFLGLKGNLVLISGGTLPDSNADGGWRTCRPVPMATYVQVLKSLSTVK